MNQPRNRFTKPKTTMKAGGVPTLNYSSLGVPSPYGNGAPFRPKELKTTYKVVAKKTRKAFLKAKQNRKRHSPREQRHEKKEELLEKMWECINPSKSTLYVLNQDEVALLWDCSIVLHSGRYYTDNEATKITLELGYRGKAFNPKGTYAFLTQVEEIKVLGKDKLLFYSGAIHNKNQDSYIILGAGIQSVPN